jgi:hypothetical protein
MIKFYQILAAAILLVAAATAPSIAQQSGSMNNPKPKPVATGKQNLIAPKQNMAAPKQQQQPALASAPKPAAKPKKN